MSIFNQLKPAFLQESQTSQESIPESLNFRRIWELALVLTSIVTLLPLIIITAIDYQFTQKSIESENLLRTLRVGSNAKRAVSHFLHERFSALSYVVHSNSYESLKEQDNLTKILNNLNESFGDFSDLGLINSKGVQSNYVGPYNLAGEDYSREDCFDEVAVRGHFVSEAFLGFRNSPHSVVSVRHDLPRGSFFVLRTALETSLLGDLLGSFELDGRGDMFLINSQGVIQTPTLYHGKVFDRLPFPLPKYSDHTEVEESENGDGEKVLICSAYIPDSPFILIIIKNKDELMKPWRDARLKLIGFLLASITVILIALLGFSTYMVNIMYRLDQRRLNALHEMEYSNKLASIGRLAAGVAHEINNPLAVINEKAGLVKDLFTYAKDSSADPRIIGLIDSIISSVDRCGTITKRLLGFARHMDSAVIKVQLGGIIKEVLGFLHKEAEYRAITVDLDIAGDIPEFESDRGKLQQIFLNIINNAFAAMEVGGRLIVVVRREGTDRVATTITDNGCGMAEADLTRIYEPFYSTKTKVGGTGLGLSITYGLIKELGGNIQVSSKLGEGTSFVVSLPLHSPKAKEE